MINNPVDRKKIQDALQEISNSMTRMDAERDLIKDIVKDLAEEHQLDKKIIRKMARTYHKQNFSEELETNEQFEQLYQNILGAEG